MWAWVPGASLALVPESEVVEEATMLWVVGRVKASIDMRVKGVIVFGDPLGPWCIPVLGFAFSFALATFALSASFAFGIASAFSFVASLLNRRWWRW